MTSAKLSGNVFLHSVHASLEWNLCHLLRHCGLRLAEANCDLSHSVRPLIPGYTDRTYSPELSRRVETLSCRVEDFDGCDFILMMNPGDFQDRVVHFAKFRPTIVYINGQWLPHQMDTLAAAMNAELNRRGSPRIYAAVYTIYEEEYLKARVHRELHSHIRYLRFPMDFRWYHPWFYAEKTGKRVEGLAPAPPLRCPFVYTSCNRIHVRAQECQYADWLAITAGFPYMLSGDRTEQIGGMGLVEFDQLRQLYWTCGVYCGVPCWPAPLVMNMVEAMCAGAPIVYLDNDQGIAGEPIFKNDVGCLTRDVSVARDFIARVLRDKAFAAEQSRQSLERAWELFEFHRQAEQWREFFALVLREHKRRKVTETKIRACQPKPRNNGDLWPCARRAKGGRRRRATVRR
jgi:hypothetical protein